MARTPGAGTISQPLIDTQNVSGRVPFIRITINSINYSARLMYIEHHEEAYRDRAIIGLNNRDNALDELDVDGKSFQIGYGYDTTDQGGGTQDIVETATLWVKSHQIISVQGERIYQIYAEGMWMYLRERKVIAGINIWQASRVYPLGETTGATTPNGHKFIITTAGTSGGTEPDWDVSSEATTVDGSVTWTENGLATPYSNTFNRTHTVYGLMELIIEGALGWTLEALGGVDDGIIDTFTPVFDINRLPFENAAALLYRLIWMTKGYLRMKDSTTVQFVFPQTSDEADQNYFSDRPHWFTEYTEKTILLIPNSIIVLCNQDPNGQWGTDAFPIIVGTASDAVQIAKYDSGNEVIQIFYAGNIRTQVEADQRAAAIITRMKSEILGGRLVIPHDARVELYDKVRVKDTRGVA